MFLSVSESQLFCADSLWVCSTLECIRTRTSDHVRTLKIITCSPWSVDYGNTKRPSMHYTDNKISLNIAQVNQQAISKPVWTENNYIPKNSTFDIALVYNST